MQMLRNIHKLIFTFVAICSLVGCNESIELPEVPLRPGDPGTITIRFNNSKSTRNTDSDNSETLISTLTICLYDSPTDDDAAPVYTRSFTPNEHNATTVVMSLTDEMIESLFTEASSYSCRMYAVANVDGLPTNPTVNQIKNHIVSSDFYSKAIQTSFAMAGQGLVKYTPSENPNEKGTAEGEGKLYRTASKIRLNISLPENIEIKDDDGNVLETWYPQTNDNAMRVLLKNGVQSAPVVPSDGWEPTDDSAYYNSNEVNRQSYRTFANGLGIEDYPYGTQVPFYTYPNTWEEAMEESHKTTLTLMVPWRKNGTDQYRSLYYQVPIVPGTLSGLTSNYAYIINMSVGMLGSPNPDIPVDVEDVNYQVVDWATEDIDVNINDYRYLVVNPNYYIANNESKIVIPFYTSHAVDFDNISISYQRFNFYDNGNGEVVNIDIDKEQIARSVSGTDTICTYHIVQNRTTNQMSLEIDHSLDMWTPVNASGQEVSLTERTGTGNGSLENVTGSIYKYEKPATTQSAYSRYIIKVKISHKDNHAFSEDIEIVQYPAMYITADPNPGGTYSEVTSFFGSMTSSQRNLGFVYVNAEYTSGTTFFGRSYEGWLNDSGLGGVSGLSGDNSNPNMYVITISQLEDGTKYIIGDPRSSFINNSLSGSGYLTPKEDESSEASWSTTANVVYPTTNSNKRKLKYYYPTYEYQASDKEAYFVAPKFRVASSYGKTSPLSKENARRRAASYQEQNCPSGRWRLPTLGEFTYINQLSGTGKIPLLFTLNTGYWTAQGAYKVDKDGNITPATGDIFIRAVYDEWYWENLTEYNMPKNQNGGYDYTLGDVPKQ